MSSVCSQLHQRSVKKHRNSNKEESLVYFRFFIEGGFTAGLLDQNDIKLDTDCMKSSSSVVNSLRHGWCSVPWNKKCLKLKLKPEFGQRHSESFSCMKAAELVSIYIRQRTFQPSLGKLINIKRQCFIFQLVKVTFNITGCSRSIMFPVFNCSSNWRYVYLVCCHIKEVDVFALVSVSTGRMLLRAPCEAKAQLRNVSSVTLNPTCVSRPRAETYRCWSESLVSFLAALLCFRRVHHHEINSSEVWCKLSKQRFVAEMKGLLFPTAETLWLWLSCQRVTLENKEEKNSSCVCSLKEEIKGAAALLLKTLIRGSWLSNTAADWDNWNKLVPTRRTGFLLHTDQRRREDFTQGFSVIK